MLQGFSGGYTMYHDTSFMIYITKLYRVALALITIFLVGQTNQDFINEKS